ncbi:hypothetical protein U9M48_039445 [Paspalum notatum var. saurae]|uniref:Uncharacterized protein n=1 Tax=Paspalum notatum var. saurae TaxID=547442 RepID=A0AAQ3UKR4_PASNO
MHSIRPKRSTRRSNNVPGAGDDICHARGCTGTGTTTVGNVCSDEFFSSTSGIRSAGVQSLPNSSASLRTIWRSGSNLDSTSIQHSAILSTISSPPEVAATTPTSQVPYEFSEQEVKLCVWTLA